MAPTPAGRSSGGRERGEDGVARVKELRDGIGAGSSVERVGTAESMRRPSTRPGQAATSASPRSLGRGGGCLVL
ncbi:hypothetical protein [Streptomyces canarius]|uniref:hypothetical protein n=1 Tax=Streptomyces TaxID=1883 RepID=UPI001678DF8A